MHTMRTMTLFLLAAFSGGPLLAQIGGGGDPQREIQELAEAIDKQLKEIDRLLLESGKPGQARQKPKEMLEQAAEGTKVVEDGLEKLIEKLEQMKNQSSRNSSGGGGEPQQQGGQQPQGQPQQGQEQMGRSDGRRRENQTPQFVDQGQQPGEQQGEGQQPKPGEQQGQQPQQQPGQSQPQGGQETPTGGENRVGDNAPQSPTGPGQRGDGQGAWGELQPYLNFLKNRGATPKVPSKFRKYYEAYRKGKVEKRQ